MNYIQIKSPKARNCVSSNGISGRNAVLVGAVVACTTVIALAVYAVDCRSPQNSYQKLISLPARTNLAIQQLFDHSLCSSAPSISIPLSAAEVIAGQNSSSHKCSACWDHHLPSPVSATVKRAFYALYQAAQLPLSSVAAQSSNSTTRAAHAALNYTTILQGTGPFPASRFAGRGIVIVGGGKKYTPPAYACVVFLRKSGCKLPIEVWYPPREFIAAPVAAEFAALGATVRSLSELYTFNGTNQLEAEELSGYLHKPAAILASSFQEVLLLDADNIALRDPTHLFDDPSYKASGLLMWPDFWSCEAKASAWELLSIPLQLQPKGSHESGQVVLNKSAGWQALLLALYLNIKGDVFYPLLSNKGQGDKETFAFAKLALAAESKQQWQKEQQQSQEQEGSWQQSQQQQQHKWHHSHLLRWQQGQQQDQQQPGQQLQQGHHHKQQLQQEEQHKWSQQQQQQAALQCIPYGLVPFPVLALGKFSRSEFKGHAMLQRGPEGGALFLHAHYPKFTLRKDMGRFTEKKRLWQYMSGEVGVLPANVTSRDAGSYRLLNAVAGYDVEHEVHRLRQHMQCNHAWVKCCL